jgi:hypothetical protein
MYAKIMPPRSSQGYPAWRIFEQKPPPGSFGISRHRPSIPNAQP